MDPMEDSTGPGPQDPMTIPERIHQLNQIDKNIVLLMSHTAQALDSLTHKPSADADSPTSPTAAQEESFRSAMDALLKTLHAVDVHMKRQIWALEEAGIVKLPERLSAAEKLTVDSEAKLLARSSLEPNGVGAVGTLDVGWLNSRSTRNERDMEAELWGRARALLEEVAQSEGNRMES
jgi:hypothetical protein